MIFPTNEDYCLSRADLQPHCKKLVRSRFVPIIHNIKTPKLHEAARELLPLAEKMLVLAAAELCSLGREKTMGR